MIDRLPRENVGVVALDTETNGLYADDGARVAVVSLAWWRDGQATGRVENIESVALPFAQGKSGKPEDDGVRSLFEQGSDPNLERQDWEKLLAWLRGRPLIMHNAKFDLEKMRAGTISRYEEPGWPGFDFESQVVWDTQIIQKELDPLESTSLKPTAKRLWGESEGDEQAALKPYLGPKTDPRFDLVPWEIIAPYAAKDAELTLRLADHQWRAMMAGEIRPEWAEREIDVMRMLYRLERRGIPYDAIESLRVAALLIRKQREIDAELPFRATDTEAKEWFFGGRQGGAGLIPYATTATGRVQMTSEIVERIKVDFAGSQIGEVASRWADRQKIATAIKMWYRPYADGIGADGRLRTCFRQVSSGRGADGGTASGRLSVERVNLQAIPHDYRLDAGENGPLIGLPTPRQIIAKAARRLEGWRLWEFDLAQAELRVAAMWAECLPMLDAIREQRDLHSETTRALFPEIEPGGPEWKRYRNIGKRGNFTLCFGAGSSTFKRMVAKESGVQLTDQEAHRIVDDWNGLYPEFRRAIERHSARADRARYLLLANGRRRWFRNGEDTHKAFNQRVQASLAELGKSWALATERLLGPDGYDLERRGIEEGVGGGGLLLLIHDSQVALLPEAEDQRMIEQIVVGGLEIWKDLFPEVPGGIDAARWDK